MADQNFNPLGTGEGESPIVPSQGSEKLDVTMRTSASDIKSMQDSGGQVPRPYVPPPSVPTYSPSGLSGIGGQPFQPPQLDQYPPASMPGNEPKKLESMSQEFPPAIPGEKKSNKKLFITILVALVVVGAGALGYFFIYPKFFKTTTPVPAIQTPEVPAVPEVPTVPEVPPAPITEALETIPAHVSLFKSPADLMVEIKLPTSNLTGLQNSVPFETAEVAVLKEIKLANADGNLLSLSGLMKFLMPDVFNQDLLKSFEPDFTMFVYSDSKGAWPGYVLSLGKDAVLADVQAKATAIEGVGLNNVFLSDPGQASTWKNGASNRYLSYSQSGAGINYGWVGNNLVIATSYSGFQEAAKRLK
ncbi:MAG: hypothetical protein AAB617_02295 [Patescibacteria group bacterium]